MATYPLGIKRFVTHRDEVDIVRAEHMNTVQSEVTAIQDVLGPNPHQDENGWTFKTVRERLEYMMRGRQTPVIQAYNSTKYTRSSDKWYWNYYPNDNSTYYDTHKMLGSGRLMVAPRSGWYYIMGQCYFNSTALKGSRVLAVMASNGTSTLALNSEDYYGESRAFGDWMQVSWFGRINKGSSIGIMTNLITGNYPNGKYSVQNAHMRGFMVRDY